MNGGIVVGVNIDVSGSMKEAFDSTSVEGEEIFKKELILRSLEIVARSFQSNTKLFSILFGCTRANTCDFCDLIKYISMNIENTLPSLDENSLPYRNLLCQLLIDAGAVSINRYIYNEHGPTDEQCQFFFKILANDAARLHQLVYNLPYVTKHGLIQNGVTNGLSALNFLTLGYIDNDSIENEKIEKHIKENLTIILKDLSRPILDNYQWSNNQHISTTSPQEIIVSIKNIQKRLPSNGESSGISLMDFCQEYIYNWTYMKKAVSQSVQVFRENQCNKRVLIIISDGASTDGDPFEEIVRFREYNLQVYIICCYLTSKNLDQPKQLHSDYYPRSIIQNNGAKKLFDMASEVDTDNPAFALLLERGWIIPEDGKCRLFIQANHPTIISEFLEISSQLFTTNDALADVVGKVSLNKYINQNIEGFAPTNQRSFPICWSHASATVIHMATARIVGRPLPTFEQIKSDIFDPNGFNFQNNHGYDPNFVLRTILPKYKLHHRVVDEKGARLAVQNKRPCIATFRISRLQFKNVFWSKFTNKKRHLHIRNLKSPTNSNIPR